MSPAMSWLTIGIVWTAVLFGAVRLADYLEDAPEWRWFEGRFRDPDEDA